MTRVDACRAMRRRGGKPDGAENREFECANRRPGRKWLLRAVANEPIRLKKGRRNGRRESTVKSTGR